MSTKLLLSVSVVFLAVLWSSCEKEDVPVTLPPKGDAEYSIVEMGEDYVYQVFFNMQNGQVVHSSEINSWHLAFEASLDGYHIFMNGGADVFLYNTHETDFRKVKTAPDAFSSEWMFDRSCGLNDSTAMGDWRNKNEIWIVKLNPTNDPNNLKKIRLVTVSADEYVMEYCDLEEDAASIVHIPKDHAYNYSYFNFYDGGQVVQPDPPKATWDFVFTRYRIIYYDMDNFPYIVNGLLTNPYQTTSYAPDSTKQAEGINDADVPGLPFTDHRDEIGYSWKYFNFDKKRYEVDKSKFYYIHNQNNQYWKLNFVGFYNDRNIKGSPSFEYVRVY